MKASIWLFICAAGGLLAAGEQVTRQHELEGNTLRIHTDEFGLEIGTYITWRYRSENEDIMIDSWNIREEGVTDYYTDRFRFRLQLNRNSGCLTIRNIRREDSGVYTVQMKKGYHSGVWSFSVDVYAPVSTPVIKNQPEECSVSPRESCSPLCTVENGKDVSLSWYEEKERIYSISRADSSKHLYLPLKIANQNPSTYTCVAANPASNQTVQLNIAELCYSNTGGLLGAGEQVTRLQELEGNTLSIHTDEFRFQIGTYIKWSYRSENEDIMIDSWIIREVGITDYYTERFRDRLQLSRKSGCLIIRNIRREDSGVYIVEIKSGDHSGVWSFSVDVYAPVSTPVIKNQPEECSVSPSGSCSPLCTVENGKDVSLYWYEEKERISSITSSDSSEQLYLPLNKTNLTSSTYTCVAANPVSNQTVQLNIAELCSINAIVNQLPGTVESNHGDNSSCVSSTQCCDSVELMVRLALSAVVVLATIAILLYHFSSRRASGERQDRSCND